jgi:KDO2-lipid IV(A) lauroyltransferase
LSKPAAGPAERRATRAERAWGRAAEALVAGVNRLPRERALALAGTLGRSWARLGGPRTAAARQHLRLAFPDWTERQRRQVLERSFANLARSFVELATLGALSPEDLRALADVEGLEHFEAARRASPTGGVIALTAHLGAWEILAALMAAHGIPIAVVQRSRDNPRLDALLARLRGRWGVELLPRGAAARAALRALREGKVLAIPFDQNASRREGVFVPFFGRPACTREAPVRLAMRTGAPVLPVFIERIGESARHRVRALPPLELVPEDRGGDAAAAVVENAARMTAAVEAAIRRAPDQWIWTHRRWRTRPRGRS